MRRILLATVALLGIAASASARADTYQLTGTVFSDALTAYIQYTGTPKVPPVDVYVGPLNEEVADITTHVTTSEVLYCDDIFNDYSSGGLYSLTQTTAVGGSAAIGDEIIALLANAPQTTAVDLAALQAAIWTVENGKGFSIYGGDTAEFNTQMMTDIESVSGSSPIWAAPADDLLDQYTSVSANNQNFVFLYPLPTPEPASILMLGTTLIGLGLVRNRRILKVSAHPTVRRPSDCSPAP
jgi:hypothetical protein